MTKRSSMNRLGNTQNYNQGSFKRVLCVCSAGLLRSPTAALVLSQAPYNYNTRAAGCVNEYALIPVDDALLTWADEVVCMLPEQKEYLEKMFTDYVIPAKPIICLNIEDDHRYRSSALIEAIKQAYGEP